MLIVCEATARPPRSPPQKGGMLARTICMPKRLVGPHTKEVARRLGAY